MIIQNYFSWFYFLSLYLESILFELYVKNINRFVQKSDHNPVLSCHLQKNRDVIRMRLYSSKHAKQRLNYHSW